MFLPFSRALFAVVGGVFPACMGIYIHSFAACSLFNWLIFISVLGRVVRSIGCLFLSVCGDTLLLFACCVVFVGLELRQGIKKGGRFRPPPFISISLNRL